MNTAEHPDLVLLPHGYSQQEKSHSDFRNKTKVKKGKMLIDLPLNFYINSLARFFNLDI